MEDNKDLQEFDLDDILNEFTAGTGDEAAPEPDLDEMSSLLDEWTREEEPQSADTAAVPVLSADSAESGSLTAQPDQDPLDTLQEDPSVPMDTLRMNELIKEIIGESQESLISDDTTIRMNGISGAKTAAGEVPSGAQTIRISATEPEEEPAASMEAPSQEVPVPEPAAKPEPNVVYNPRTRLRELKRQLVAGPEKRYYELSGMGVGRIQLSILLNLALVVLCVIVATLYSLDMIPENRLRFVIFSQVLSMLLSAFLGCGQILEGLIDLFKGRFSVNSMLGFTFAACCADAVFCLSELRIPCCAAFSLEITMALWAQYQRHSTEMAQMDTMRKAARLNAMVKEPQYYHGKAGILRRHGNVSDFMDQYKKRSGPEIVQGVYCFLSLLLCCGIAFLAASMHGISLGIQILSTSLLVAVPASFFVTLTRPAALLGRRLHMAGTVLCGWQGVKGLCGKTAFPLRDEDLFPPNTTKLNGFKFYGERDPDEVVSYTTSLIYAAGGSLVKVFQQLLASRNGLLHHVENFRDYGSGGIGGEVCGEPILIGTLDFLQDMGVEIPDGTMVNQAVYASIDGQLSGVFAISYAKMRSSSAGLVSLCGNRKITPVLTGCDFMITDSLLRAKFNVNTRRIAFPDQEDRVSLDVHTGDEELPALALATRDELTAYAYAVSGAQALRASCRLGVLIHLIGGIVGMLIMAALAFLNLTDLLTPTHVLLYQLVWIIPGLLITEWARTV